MELILHIIANEFDIQENGPSLKSGLSFVSYSLLATEC